LSHGWVRVRNVLFFACGLVLFIDEIWRDESGPGWLVILINLYLMGAVTGDFVMKLVNRIKE